MRSSDIYKSTAWKWFSKYIKLRDRNKKDNTVRCITCGKIMHYGYDKIVAGHYQKAGNGNTCFDERNVHCQCNACNYYHGGKMDIMAVEIDKKLGFGTAEELRMKAKIPFKLDKFTLNVIAKEYRLKVKELEKG